MIEEKKISVKREPFEIPCYSLSSDLLGYRQCPLQYRFVRISQLPPSRPVQMWFGEFVHFVLEHSFKYYKKTKTIPTGILLEEICEKVRKKLATRGIFARNRYIYKLAVDRVILINEKISPDLFKLMEYAEKKVSGTEKFDTIYNYLPADRFEITGVIDILSKNKLQLHDKIYTGNLIKKKILDKFKDEKKSLPSIDEEYEMIVDYKGMIRPPKNNPTWERHKLQLLLYKFLREKQPDANKVIAGILIYINEIKPTKSDLKKIFKKFNFLDIKPEKGSSDYIAIKNKDLNNISEELKIDRTIRIEILDDELTMNALQEFKKTVIEIEKRKFDEKNIKNIIDSWKPDSAPDKDTCAPCDYRYKCPASYRHGTPESPFEFDEEFDFSKQIFDLEYFTKGDNKIEERAKEVRDDLVKDIYYDDYLIKAEINEKKVEIDFNKKTIYHTGCIDFTRRRMDIKTFCKHIYKLFQVITKDLGEEIVSDILQIIGEDIFNWSFKS